MAMRILKYEGGSIEGRTLYGIAIKVSEIGVVHITNRKSLYGAYDTIDICTSLSILWTDLYAGPRKLELNAAWQ